MAARSVIEYKITESNRIALDICWPRLGPLVGGMLHRTAAHEQVDRDAHIDLMWSPDRSRRRFGVSVRYQIVRGGGSPWRTFTLRTKTELLRYLEVLAGGGLMPDYMLHAYLDEQLRPVTMAWAPSADVVRARGTHEYVNPEDGTRFVAARWSAIPTAVVWDGTDPDVASTQPGLW